MTRAMIGFTGDIMCQPGYAEMCTVNGRRDFSRMFARISGTLNECDYLVGNLETPIAGEDLGFTNERYCFNSPTEFAEEIKRDGFDLVCLANNHCMDRGEEGIFRTLDNLDRIGLPHTGLNRPGEKRWYAAAINGIRVSFVNYTYGSNAFAHHRFLSDDLSGTVNLFQPQETLPGSIHLLESMETIGRETDRLYRHPSDEYDRYIKPHLDMLRNDIADVKAESDFTVVVMHSGGQYNPTPDPYTLMLAEKIREYGADCIVGHHPHILHGYDVKYGVLCAYSIGNLLCIPSSMQDPVGTAYSALLRLTLEKDEKGTRLTDAGFSLIRTIEPENGAPYCVECSAPGDFDTDEALRQASILSGRTETALRHVYHIDIN